MKKKNLRNLSLNKKSVSNLQSETVKGGATYFNCNDSGNGTCRCTGSWCWISLNEGPCPK